MIILLICLLLSILTVAAIIQTEYFSIEINYFFILSMTILLIVTLFISMVIPVYRILKISPAEVIK